MRKSTEKVSCSTIALNTMGMGCTVGVWHGKKRITHNGGHAGFRTLHIQPPEDDFDIIYLSNSAWADARNDFAEAVHDAYYGADNFPNEAVKMDARYFLTYTDTNIV